MEFGKDVERSTTGDVIQRCSIHLLSGRGSKASVFTLGGYSVCEEDACIEAIADGMHQTIMNARAID